jgi:hypothetical protein
MTGPVPDVDDDSDVGEARHYAIGDVHGCVEPLRAALRAKKLIDPDDDWTGGRARVHFLGDLTDRGPDGVGVIDLVMRLQEQAPDAGGVVDCVLGNHEVMLLAAHRLTSRRFHSDTARFKERWRVNGGQESDSQRLTDTHFDWLTSLPCAVRVGDHLLLHADSMGYLELGDDVPEINATVRAILDDLRDFDAWDRATHLLTSRFAFAADDGVAVIDFLETLGALQVVHGHSPIPLLLGVPPESVVAPLVYAGGRAVNMDTGTFLGGPCLVNELPAIPPWPLRPDDEPTERVIEHVDDEPTETLPPVIV